MSAGILHSPNAISRMKVKTPSAVSFSFMNFHRGLKRPDVPFSWLWSAMKSREERQNKEWRRMLRAGCSRFDNKLLSCRIRAMWNGLSWDRVELVFAPTNSATADQHCRSEGPRDFRPTSRKAVDTSRRRFQIYFLSLLMMHNEAEKWFFGAKIVNTRETLSFSISSSALFRLLGRIYAAERRGLIKLK